MSKELQTIDTYIEQQQSQISELMQTIMLLQTKVKMLESENKWLKDINSTELDEDGEVIVRKGLRSVIDPTRSKRIMDPVQQKTVIKGFAVRNGIPEEYDQEVAPIRGGYATRQLNSER
jgi:hypothetical protein